jgi:hypothetical protein
VPRPPIERQSIDEDSVLGQLQIQERPHRRCPLQTVNLFWSMLQKKAFGQILDVKRINHLNTNHFSASMLIANQPFLESFGIVTTLILLSFLVTYELLSEDRRKLLKGFFLGAIVILLSAFVFIIVHRLEGIV